MMMKGEHARVLASKLKRPGVTVMVCGVPALARATWKSAVAALKEEEGEATGSAEETLLRIAARGGWCRAAVDQNGPTNLRMRSMIKLHKRKVRARAVSCSSPEACGHDIYFLR